MRGTHDPAVLKRISEGYTEAISGMERCSCGRWMPCLHCRQDKRAVQGAARKSDFLRGRKRAHRLEQRKEKRARRTTRRKAGLA